MSFATRVNCLAMAAALASLTTALTAGCQSAQPKPPATVPTTQLEPYTAPDQSASAEVPSGWKVTKGQDTVIQMGSPDGVTIFLGTAAIAKNATFQPGQHASNGIDISMPYSAPLGQKLTMILQQNAAIAGLPAPQITIDSSTPLQLPAAVGQCGRFVADISGQDAKKLMAVVCSLPLDTGGTYKNILLLAQAPAAVAAQAAPTAQAVFQSYRIPPTWLQKKLAPFTAPPPAAASAAAAAIINRSTIIGAIGADNSAKCFDLSVLRETPTAALPRSCGGTMPD